MAKAQGSSARGLGDRECKRACGVKLDPLAAATSACQSEGMHDVPFASPRVGRALGLVVVGCAVVASVATSCDGIQGHFESHEGPQVELTAESPRAEFEVAVSPNGALRAAEADSIALEVYARVVCDDAATCADASDGGIASPPRVVLVGQRIVDGPDAGLASVVHLPLLIPDAGVQYFEPNFGTWNAQGESPLRVFVRFELIDDGAGAARVTWDVVASALSNQLLDEETIENADLFIVFEDPPGDFVPNLPASDAGVVDAGLD